MAFITTVKQVKTIIPNQAVVNYLVKDWIFEDKIRNVTIFLQAFLNKNYAISEALIATQLGFELAPKHIGIQDVSNVYYYGSVGSEYGTGYGGPVTPKILTKDIDYTFGNVDLIIDDTYNLDAFTFGLSKHFTEQIIYENKYLPKEDLGYIQYRVVGGNDSGSIYNLSLEILGDKPFFMDSFKQQLLINAAMDGEENELSPIIQLLAAYIVAKDVITEYILPVFRQDTDNNLAGVQLNSSDLLPGFEEFIKSLDDKIADIWALLKYKGKLTVNPNGPNGPEKGPYADKARAVVRGSKVSNFESPFSDGESYLRSRNSSGSAIEYINSYNLNTGF